jgi:hypothetical protein
MGSQVNIFLIDHHYLSVLCYSRNLGKASLNQFGQNIEEESRWAWKKKYYKR